MTQGKCHRRDIALGDHHVYPLQLAIDDFLEIEVRQRGADIRALFRDPENRVILDMDSPNADWGNESLIARATKPGSHSLLIEIGGSKAGAYEVCILKQKPADAADRQLALAAQYDGQGDLQVANGNYHQALDSYGRAIEIWNQLERQNREARSHDRRGSILRSSGDALQAIEAWTTAIDLFLQADDLREAAALASRLGNYQRKEGRHQEAIEVLRCSLSLFEELGDQRRQASILNRLALTYDDIGKPATAIELLEVAIAHWQDLGLAQDEAVSLTNLGEIYLLVGQPEIALIYLDRALVLRRQEKDLIGESLTLTATGTAMRRLNRIQDAERNFRQALKTAQRQGHLESEALAWIGLGLTLSQDGREAEARNAYVKALDRTQRTGDEIDEGFVRVNLGRLESNQGRIAESMVQYLKAREIFSRHGERNGEATALYGLARGERVSGNFAEAQRLIEQAIERIESIHGAVHSEVEGASFLDSKRHYYQLLVNILLDRSKREPGLGFDFQALQASELGRSRSLLDSLVEAQMEMDHVIAPARMEEIRNQRNRMGQLGAERALLWDSGASVEELAEIDSKLEALALEYRRSWAQIRSRHPALEVFEKPQPPTLLELREMLDEETLLLEFSIGEERSTLWVVGADTPLSVHHLPASSLIEPRVRRLHELLRHSRSSTAQPSLEVASAGLSELLLGNISEQLAGKRLLIVADGILHYLPFAVLSVRRDQEGKPVPLATDHEIVYVPSLTVLKVLKEARRQRVQPTGTIIAVGDPVITALDRRAVDLRGQDREVDFRPAGSSMRLPATGRELEAIRRLVPEEKRHIAVGFDASLDLVLSGKLAGYRIVHFATHAQIDAAYPELSRLLLSTFDRTGRRRPGELWLPQIYSLDLPVDLVVLSACQTALGKHFQTEGFLGLADGFLYAGASRVLVSLWDVNDAATAELMERFYVQILERGLAPASALQLAQAEMMRDERWAAPFYWAGFVLQGEWQ